MKACILQFGDKEWQCDYAATFFERGMGLLGRKAYPNGKIFIIPKCGSVHTWFMQFNLDIVFLDKRGKVLKIKNNVPPWRMIFGGSGAVTTLEAMSISGEASVFDGICVGETLVLK